MIKNSDNLEFKKIKKFYVKLTTKLDMLSTSLSLSLQSVNDNNEKYLSAWEKKYELNSVNPRKITRIYFSTRK